MNNTDHDVASAVAKEACHQLDEGLGKIKHCLDQLTDEQVWWRPESSMNSIANLMLHLCGNLRQWIVSGVGEADDIRDRPKEFSEHGPIEKYELLRQLGEAVNDANAAVISVPAAGLLEVRRIQGFDKTGIAAIFDSVSHFRGHTQEIIHMTRCLIGDNYHFAFVPATPEQGASKE